MSEPAFPTSRYNAESAGSVGMDLRDYFAAQAMAAIIVWDVHGEQDPAFTAEMAYRQADAMLMARTRSFA